MNKKCKYCGTIEHLRKDKKGKIYNCCEECYRKYNHIFNRKFSSDSYKEQIIDLYLNQNKTAKEISIIINISKDQIWDALKRWGVKAKTKGERAKVNLTEKQKDQLIQLVNNGFSSSIVAQKIGVTKDIVYERAKELNLKFISEHRSFNNIECVYCKKEFKPTSARNTFCSEECKLNQRILTLCKTTNPMCYECGMEYTPDYTNVDPKFCSKSCAAKYNQRNMSEEEKIEKLKKQYETILKNGGFKRSKNENELCDFIKQYTPIIKNDRNILFPKEIDILIPDLKIGIEYDDLWSHSELRGQKDKKYHLEKTLRAKEKGIKLIHIFSNEWINKKNIVKSRILNILGKTSNIVYARNCEIKIIESQMALLFCKENHIQGKGKNKIAYGLFHENQLISVMTFDHMNISKNSNREVVNDKEIWELSRFCNKINYSVIGGASKLLKGFIKDNNPKKIISYADLRWSEGNLYQKLGFILDHVSRPNYWYIKNFNECKIYHRFQFRKNKNDNLSLTEWQNRINQGFDRIWDCGNQCWIMDFPIKK